MKLLRDRSLPWGFLIVELWFVRYDLDVIVTWLWK